ncbi:hypothetical protein [Aquimarina brevivitae]|uniref:Uncharacterized protein n=1 Tax=Aquimarina brevivitae TaxID=323412 RepID=A0A4Q7P1F1_9FLAO|nr:hypothetical protein [Aquimarina brevivitae]RZS93387.1 hypothetical protein EV197_1965 [Aquimarina brevivitae]
MKLKITPLLIILFIWGCSNTEPTGIMAIYSDFEEVTTFPKTYSSQDSLSKKILLDSRNKTIPNTEANHLMSDHKKKPLVLEYTLNKNHILHPLNSIIRENYTIGIFLERDSTRTQLIENDIIHFMIHDKEGKPTEQLKLQLEDAYGSFQELIVINDKQICIKHCNLEYSPDPESEGSMEEPDYFVVSEYYTISKDSLKLKLDKTTKELYQE